MPTAQAARLAPLRREAPRPSSPPPARLRLRRPRPRADLRASVGDAAAYSLMVGIGETYFSAFALALGTGETVAGLVATLPMLVGATLQLATPWFLQRTGSCKQWVVLCASLQATALLLMPVAAWLIGRPATAWIFLAATLYWAASQAAGPAWNTWMEEVVPRRLRANFFACRARISQMATLAGFVIGGLALQAGKASGWLLGAFVGIFLVGAACRFVSAWFLSQQTEPSRGRFELRHVSFISLLRGTSGEVGIPLVLYLLAVQTAVQISGPYFTPYMLAQRKLTYLSYMVLIGIGFLGKVLALPMWGRVAHYAGARRLLWIGGTAIVPVAALWIGADLFAAWETQVSVAVAGHTVLVPLSGEMAYLAGVQLISGIVWAAYELAMLLMFFEAIPCQQRASVLTFYNFGNAAALVLGGLIGATILQAGHELHGAYLVLFGASSLARLGTVVLLWRAPERRVVNVRPATRVIAVRADEGAVERPILPSLSERPRTGAGPQRP
jgi:MFS family permease